jgi:DNA-directed RNA polymerase specialized sigma24 family protein
LVAVLLARLDSSLREIVELKVFGALTFREISEVTGLPQGTVATRYRSALETMRGQPAKE